MKKYIPLIALLCACNKADLQQTPSYGILTSAIIYDNGQGQQGTADGNRAIFAAQYSNAVDQFDALKLTNPGENFGIRRAGKILAVECRQPISTDTLFLHITNLSPAMKYQFVFIPQNIAASSAVLYDRRFNTYHRIGSRNGDTTRIAIRIKGGDMVNRFEVRLRN